ncbi:MAG TPA: rhomboid family intramembrane serine protease [Bacteroidales bacterium]|nr:rhomboid family intramembrane serine protease [Bacteroidales bacterium]
MDFEKRKLVVSLYFPVFIILVIWIIKISEVILKENWSHLGVYPMKIEGLLGIVTSPLIHGDFNHLIANTGPLFILTLGLFYFYSKIAWRVFFLIYFITGIWVWFGAREAYHIGASGVVYGLAAFIGLSGIIRKNVQLTAISFLVIFLYGGMIWGVLPIDPRISWEGHLSGAIAGLMLAYYFRKMGPPSDIRTWKEIDDSDVPDDENAYWKVTDQTMDNVQITYKEDKKDEPKTD